jgi:hypothetical protein
MNKALKFQIIRCVVLGIYVYQFFFCYATPLIGNTIKRTITPSVFILGRAVTSYDNDIISVLLAGDKFTECARYTQRFRYPCQEFQKNPLFLEDSFILSGLGNTECHRTLAIKLFEKFSKTFITFGRNS